MRKVVLDYKGQRLVGAVAKVGNTTWFSFNGEVWTKEDQGRKSRGAKSGSLLDPSKIQAPMPGKIVKVMVDSGQRVACGDVVVVMEAMKMEYTLKAASDGTIKSIQCVAGDQVALGTTLLELNAEVSAEEGR
jgi:acetyl/propionyl-CoA carboxylase alpha subunit